MRTDQLDYDLPEQLIATRPAEPRDACRLMVVSRSDASVLEHARFADLPGFLRAGDALVYNTSGVLPARLLGVRKDTGGGIEGLFLSEISTGWRVLLKSNGRLRAGHTVLLGQAPDTCEIELIERDAEDPAAWIVRPAASGSASEVLPRIGATPLPPYILRQRKHTGERVEDRDDRAWYQTVYANAEESGSVAAPTAGMHFTPELLARIANMPIARADVRLDVGVGTFKPIESERVEEHPMHAEWVRVRAESLRTMDEAKRSGGRVIAVGTTSVRAIESVPSDHRTDYEGWTRLMIAPGYSMSRTDGLITNFHLPRSTLLLLVGALFGADHGIERVKAIYTEAVRRAYRFYSYGDAMLILP